MRSLFLLIALAGAASAMACATGRSSGSSPTDAAVAHDAAESSVPDASTHDVTEEPDVVAKDVMVFDISSEPPPLDPDAACATSTEEATLVALPVDIIWVVDNSASMEPAIEQVTAGLNDFAALIAAKNLDYRVIMLSYRSKTNPVTINGGTRYGVCIPPPLAGDDQCNDGTRFFQSSIDVRSLQTLEQFLGTLGQTAGYTELEEKGGAPWKDKLRDGATRTIVVLSDDNARLGADNFEHFAGGQNPYNSLTLPPGILQPDWQGLFDGYVFHALYGWGSDTDVNACCTYADQTQPPSSGTTYTELVKKTGGVRAQICDVASAWQPFFESVAQAVYTASKLSCELPIPTPDGGTIDTTKINVTVEGDSTSTTVPNVANATECSTDQGWYYDNPVPTKVILCPASCDYAQGLVGPGKTGKINVVFGCETVVKVPK